MSQNGAIKRFTYDFLVRLAETLPENDEKFKQVSPLFTSLEKKYAVDSVYFYNFTLNQKCFDEIVIKRSASKTMKIQGLLSLHDFDPEGFQSKIIARKICFDAACLSITDCEFSPTQLRYLLSGGRHNFLTILRCTLTEPMNFSELWPYLSICSSANLDIKNLIVDETTGQDLFKRSNRSYLFDMTLTNVPLDQDAIRSIISYLVSTENEVPSVTLKFDWDAPMEWLRKTATAMEDIEKIRTLGSKVWIDVGETNFRCNKFKTITFKGIASSASTMNKFRWW
uniref:FTH domain-containing protein n=1 Tax=Panagrellus redivivus TaxID=6233 RepID=A0A7E4VPY4_PANRE